MDLDELRAGVREVCGRFGDRYWRDLDAERAYPEAYVQAMTEAGHLAALIPTELGGLELELAHACAILEEVNRSGGNANAAHAQMYVPGRADLDEPHPVVPGRACARPAALLLTAWSIGPAAVTRRGPGGPATIGSRRNHAAVR